MARLDVIALDWGIKREAGEDNQSLRQRVVTRILGVGMTKLNVSIYAEAPDGRCQFGTRISSDQARPMNLAQELRKELLVRGYHLLSWEMTTVVTPDFRGWTVRGWAQNVKKATELGWLVLDEVQIDPSAKASGGGIVGAAPYGPKPLANADEEFPEPNPKPKKIHNISRRAIALVDELGLYFDTTSGMRAWLLNRFAAWETEVEAPASDRTALEAAVSKMTAEAAAGGCEVSAQAKHNSLERILKMGQAQGFNVLGERKGGAGDRAALLELLDNVSAIAETMFWELQKTMTPADKLGRMAIIKQARELCDKELRPDDDEGDE